MLPSQSDEFSMDWRAKDEKSKETGRTRLSKNPRLGKSATGKIRDWGARAEKSATVLMQECRVVSHAAFLR
jgi:hypothetical protein